MQEVKNKKGFFIIPEYSNYCINKKGMVYNLVREEYLEGNTNPAGYHNFRLSNESGTMTLGRHVLMKRTFDFRKDYMDLVVDHDNGVKGDDRLPNLIWKTQQNNLESAGAKGLTIKCKPVIIIDIKNKIRSKYPSIAECSRATGLGVDAIAYRIQSTKGIPFKDGKIYRFERGYKNETN